jgi:hypothetical protein
MPKSRAKGVQASGHVNSREFLRKKELEYSNYKFGTVAVDRIKYLPVKIFRKMS